MTDEVHSQAPAESSAADPDAIAFSQEVDTLAGLVVARVAGEFSPEQIEGIKARLRNQLTTSRRLHEFPLTNADEPAVMFVPMDEEP